MYTFGYVTKQKFEGQIPLNDVSEDVFSQFLRYLYSGKFSNAIGNQFCLAIVIELFEFSKRHSAVELEQICIKFVIDYCLAAIHTTNFIDYLKMVSKFTANLMSKMFGHLALKYQHSEIPDCVLLDLPFDRSLDETVTHHAKSNTPFESTNFVQVKESFRNFQDFSQLKSLSCEQLLLDMKSMLNGGKHCDVVLLVEGKQFCAHKSILAAHSPVFEAMFRYDWKENLKNRVEMHDVKGQVFEQFMLYLYTGKVYCPIMAIHAIDLFVLADMHCLSTLQEMCLRMFGQSLTPESMYEQFELADRLGLTEFKPKSALISSTM